MRKPKALSGRIYGEEAPPALTLETVNKTINDALARFQKDHLPGVITTAVTTATKGLTDQFATVGTTMAAIQESLTARGGGEGDGGQGGKKKKDSEEGDGMTPAVRAAFDKLTRENAALKTGQDALQKGKEDADARALKTAKESALRGALAQFTFAGPEAAEDAFSLLLPKIEVEDGTGAFLSDGLPLADFVTTFVPTKKPHLLAPVGKGGAGAANGGQRGGQKAFTMEDIKPGMSNEDIARASSTILAAIKNG